METLKNNNISIYGQLGKIWMLDLKSIIIALQKYWRLKEIKAVDNLTYNFVAKALKDNNSSVILKIGCSSRDVDKEKEALKHFNGKGSIGLLDYNSEYNALLLQQAIPGITLKSLYLQNFNLVIDSYIAVMETIHDNPLPKNGVFSSVSYWLDAIDNFKSNKIPRELVDKAIRLKNHLLKTMKNIKLLHGDLHCDNILQNNEEWISIDPKGILGEAEFEIAAFDFIDQAELNDATSDLFVNRIESVSKKANMSPKRVKEWTFVRLILSAVWFAESNGDLKKPIQLAKLLNAI